MKTLIALILMIGSIVNAQDLRHFNPRGVLGKSIDDAIEVFLPSGAPAIQPLSIVMDVSDGKYSQATLTYPKKLSLEQARESLNRLYKKWENPFFDKFPTMRLWNVKQGQITIQLTEEKDFFCVKYISFPTMNRKKHAPNQPIHATLYSAHDWRRSV